MRRSSIAWRWLIPVLGGCLLWGGHARLADGAEVVKATTEGQAWSAELERCLLDRLRAARAGDTVEEIRGACGLSTPFGPVLPAPAAGAASPELPGAGSEAPARASTDAPVDPRLATVPPDAPVQRRMASEARLWSERFALLPHRPNYVHPLSWAMEQPSARSDGERTQRAEIKFQVSFKLPLTPPLFEGRAALFFAYTGQSWWQAYNTEVSSPFREYNHEPELIAAWRPSWSLLGWDLRLAQLGFVHQSNGRTVPYSRSWNRLFAEFTFDRPGNYWFSIRPWWRIPESEKPSPEASEGDDNPDITRYVGHAELRFGYASGDHNWTFMLRHALQAGGKGAFQADYSYPTGVSPQLRWHLQYFDGYGESLIDYRTRVRRIGIGLMLNDWF